MQKETGVAEQATEQIVETSLLRGQVKLLQPKEGYRAAVDTVFMAAAVPVKERFSLLEAGCGVGAASLCVALKNKNISLIGLDIQKHLINIARQNAVLNDAGDICCFFDVDLAEDKTTENNSFDSVFMNPPYMQAGKHTPSPHSVKKIANGEHSESFTLKNWIKYAHLKLKHNGYVTIIQRADRLDEIIRVMTEKKWFGRLVILPFSPHVGEPAKRVIVRARKEKYGPLVLKSPFVVHEADGRYTTAAAAVLEGRADNILGEHTFY